MTQSHQGMGYLVSCISNLTGTIQWPIAKKVPTVFTVGIVFALPIFPGSRPPSIVGADELNFCVRDGNRWTLIAINTNYDDGCEPSLYISKAFASNILVTHTGFEPMLTA